MPDDLETATIDTDVWCCSAPPATWRPRRSSRPSHGLETDGKLGMPVVGVASSEWTDEELRARAEESIAGQTAASTPRWLARCANGSPTSAATTATPSTYDDLAQEGRRLPATRSSTSRSRRRCSTTWCRASTSVGLTEGAKVVVEKPFGRDRAASARELNDGAAPGLPRVGRVPHRPLPRQGRHREPAGVPLRQLDARAGLEPQLHLERPDHDGRGASARRAGPSSTTRPARSATSCRTTCSRSSPCSAMEPPVGGRRRRAARREGQALPPDPHLRAVRHGVRGQYRGYIDEPGVAPGSDTETFVALQFEIESWRWAGVPWLIRAGKDMPVTATEAVVEFHTPPRMLFAPTDAPAPQPNHLRFRLGNDERHPPPAARQGARRPVAQPSRRPRGHPARSCSATPTSPTSGCSRTPWRATPAASAAPTASTSSGASCEQVLEDPPPVHLYYAGTWGPPEAEALAAPYGGWHEPLP